MGGAWEYVAIYETGEIDPDNFDSKDGVLLEAIDEED